MTSTARAPYRGTERVLVISIDFGTTFSGTSWVLLDPRQNPKVWDVSGFKGQKQRHRATSTKVPTVLLYDNEGQLRAAGNQIMNSQTIIESAKEGWTRVEWFKLLLRPDHLARQMDKAPKPKIPPNKTLVQLISDFLRYMGDLSHQHFIEKTARGTVVWEEVKHRIRYILSYPNGWNTSQHAVMREAAVLAGLVPNPDEASDRIHFVSEGEASLHWCMSKGVGRDDLQEGNHFIVIDAGGGTIDISSFVAKSLNPLEFQETQAPECCLTGSVFVTQAFRKYVEDKLGTGGSAYGDPETIDRLVLHFDDVTKCNFESREETSLVTFGANENEPEFGIIYGRLEVPGTTMADFYEKACAATVGAVRDRVTPYTKTTAVLVGGFGESDYLYEELKERFESLRLNIDLLRVDDATRKAAASGAIGFYLDHFVSARAARWTYGLSCIHHFDMADPKHMQRILRAHIDPINGGKFIDGGFFVYLKKGVVVKEAELTLFPFFTTQAEKEDVRLTVVLECYRGDVPDIKFRDEDDEWLFQELCSIEAVIPAACLIRKAKKKTSFFASTEYYWVCNFHIAVSFGAAEFKFYIEWKDQNGETQSGPVTPIWDEG